MSEDRLERIESKLEGLAGTVQTLAGTVATLVAGQARLEGGQAKLEAQQELLKAGHEELQAGQTRLGNQMRVLFEDTLDRMKSLDPAPLIDTLRRENAEAHDRVTRRLDVIDLSVREFWRRQASR
jgi:hypothetical protein